MADYRSDLASKCQGLARCLTYNGKPLEAKTKHLLLEASHALAQHRREHPMSSDQQNTERAIAALTERELVSCLSIAGVFGTVRMSYESGPYEITRPSINASRLADAITRALAVKNGLELKEPSHAG